MSNHPVLLKEDRSVRSPLTPSLSDGSRGQPVTGPRHPDLAQRVLVELPRCVLQNIIVQHRLVRVKERKTAKGFGACASGLDSGRGVSVLEQWDSGERHHIS